MRYGYIDLNNFKEEELDNPKLLLEKSYKELQSLTLPQISARAKSQSLSVSYKGISKEGVIHFQCSSGTHPGKYYNQYIKLLDLPFLLKDRKDYKDRDLVNLAVFGDIAVYCDDPSFKYYGWQYMTYLNGCGLKREVRYPSMKNPYLKGSICKHLFAVFNAFPMYINSFVKDFRKVKIL